MQGPFPGMDPYLEEPGLWPDVHSSLITAIRDALAASVAPAFIVRIEQRVYITNYEELSRQGVVPDLYVLQRPPPSGGAATAPNAISPAVTLEPLYDEEVRDRYIEILDARGHEVVTTIELLSPANKDAESRGRAQFLAKRETILHSRTNWVEIDLLRAGQRPPEVAGQSDYYALQRRAGRRQYLAWYWNLREPLPTIAVPLTADYADVPLDLGAILAGVYAHAFYALSVDYTGALPAPRPLPPDAAWIAGRLRAWRDPGGAAGA